MLGLPKVAHRKSRAGKKLDEDIAKEVATEAVAETPKTEKAKDK